jgi:hypothetical protein
LIRIKPGLFTSITAGMAEQFKQSSNRDGSPPLIGWNNRGLAVGWSDFCSDRPSGFFSEPMLLYLRDLQQNKVPV